MLQAVRPDRGKPAGVGTGARARSARTVRSIGFALFWILSLNSVGAASAAPDSVATPAAPADSVASAAAVAPVVAADTLGGALGVSGDTTRVPIPSTVDFEAQRKRGEVSFDAALLGRRAALFQPLPLYGAPQGFLSTPDAGSPIRTDRLGVVADAATDRTVVDTGAYGLGVPDLSIAFTDPRGDNVEPMDMTALSSSLKPGPFDRAGGLLAEPEGRWASSGAMPGGAPKATRTKSALYYGNGDSGEKEVGVRFVMPSLGEGIAASYARHEADGTSPLNHAQSTRYAGAIGLPRFLSHSFWIEGKSMDRDIEVDILRVDPQTSDLTIVLGSAQTSAGDVSLHGRAAGEDWQSQWLLRNGLAKRTQVDPDSGRVEWDFPEWGLQWQGTKRGPVWTGTAYVTASSRHIQYDGPETVFDVGRAAARVGVGVRRALGAGAGLGFDLAPDFRETEPALLNARLSYWRENPRFSARVDLETAHERPSWVDLLTPVHVISVPRIDYTGTLQLSVSGDPTLGARRLDGGLAAASYRASKSLTLAATGSLRHVENDFGWNLYGAAFLDTLYLANVAQHRGDGWTSHGSLNTEFRARWLTVRALAWARGGPSDLTPRSGSPPRYGGEGAADLRTVLFRGDVALTLGMRGRASGPRAGILELPGQASWDAAIRADFGQAAAFMEWMNVFDNRVASAMVGLYGDGTVLMPGTAFHFGFVWYLFD